MAEEFLIVIRRRKIVAAVWDRVASPLTPWWERARGGPDSRDLHAAAGVSAILHERVVVFGDKHSLLEAFLVVGRRRIDQPKTRSKYSAHSPLWHWRTGGTS